jgi:alpha-L-rhamnosidase
MLRPLICVLAMTFIARPVVGSGPPGREAAVSTPLQIDRLRVENLVDPLGIDVPIPRFSWQPVSVVRGERQTAYQIVVASRPEFLKDNKGDVWNTGKVSSDQSVLVEYRGAALRSTATYYWKVRVWDKDDRQSSWSEPAFWSMGLLRPEDWQARWIGHDGDVGSDSSEAEHRPLAARMLRDEFELEKHVKRAYAYVCGLGLSELWLNGTKVGDDVLSPGLSQYDRSALYVTYDVTRLLRKGGNAVGVILGNGRFFAPRKTLPVPTVTFGYPKLLLQMHVEFIDGTTKTITSNEGWKWSAEGPIREDNEYDGEVYDARREIDGWSEPGFDDVTWSPVQVVAPGSPRLEAQMDEPIRVCDHVMPVAVTSPRSGVYMFDMGQNMVGWARLKAQGPAGTRVTMRFAETLDKDGNLYMANLRSARQSDTYILRGRGSEVYEPRFTYHGFRYVEVTGYPGNPDANTILGCVVHDDVASTGSFTSSNPLLNHIVRNTAWGILGNYRSVPTDCPQRDERHGWLGDRAIESGGESFLFDVEPLYAKWLDDIREAQHVDGRIPDLAPAYWPFYNDNVTWAGTYLIIPHMLYRQFGDRRIIEQHYATMKLWLAHMDRYMADGVMPRDTYGDWCVPPELTRLIHTEDPARMTSGAFIGSAYYYHILQLMAGYANLLRRREESNEYALQADSLKENINRKFYDSSKKLYVNGTVTSSLLGLAFNLVPAGDRTTLSRNLATRVMTSDGGHVATGLIGCQWLYRTLSDIGRPDIAYTLLTQETYPSLGYMLTKGATTIWELWNGDTGDPGMNSQNHVMLTGDLLIWLFENVAGIRADEHVVGFKRIIMQPTPLSDLKWVDASYHSVYGPITSKWDIRTGDFVWKIGIPANTTAEISVPADSLGQISEGGKSIAQAAGVSFVRADRGAVVLHLESGSYDFVSKMWHAPVPAPVIERENSSGKVTMTAASDCVRIRYTVDGEVPTNSSSLYTGPFVQVQPADINARTFAHAGQRSLVTTATLAQLTVPSPSIHVELPVVEEPGTTRVTVTSAHPDAVIRYTLDGSEPTAESPMYVKPIVVNRFAMVNAAAFLDEWKPSPAAEAVVLFTYPRPRVTLDIPYSPRYPGTGERALIDGITGSTDYRDSAWQGYEGTDMVAVLDLGKELPVSNVSLGFLDSPNDWIFPPVEVEYFLSSDGKQYSRVAREELPIDSTVFRASVVRTHPHFPEVRARYVRVHARNIGICPPWHPGAGGKAWIFVDELAVR